MKRLNNKQRYIQSLEDIDKLWLQEIEELALSLFSQYDISFMKFRFTNSYRFLGCCSKEFITLDIDYCLTASRKEIMNTLLHEIAHAIVGTEHGHRKVWQDKARELGVTWTKNYHR